MAKAETLTALDATFLELEQIDDGALMSIGGVMVFDPASDASAPDVDAVRATLAGRLAQLPRYVQRLSSTETGGLAWPHWEADPHFDIRQHVRHAALRGPGSETQLCEWTAEFFSLPLDRGRPLWEIVLLDGLEERRWALAHKTHHCLLDGVGSVDIVDTLLDGERHGRRAPKVRETQPSSRPRELRHPPEAIVQATQAGARAAAAGVHAVVHPRDVFHRSRTVAELILRDELIGAPRTSLNVPIRKTRRFAVVRVPLSQLKTIGRELGGSVNDVLLAACTGAFRRMLLSRGEKLPSRGLRAMVPREVQPVVPLAAEHAVGIAIFSCNGLVTIGINADRDATPDIDVLASGIEQGIEDLWHVLPIKSTSNRTDLR